MRTVAALYVDPRGPYPTLPGVDAWDEARDARAYAGPHPIVAHPPCGPWWAMATRSQQDRSLALLAVAQVQRWGGVLEHPARSMLFRACDLPRPGELPDRVGGVTIEVNQVDWGHCCLKPTWVYLVGVRPQRHPRMPSGTPTHGIWYGESERSGARHKPGAARLLAASQEIRRRTPLPFAAFLVELARASRVSLQVAS